MAQAKGGRALLTAADGRQLAADLLRELKVAGVDECMVDAKYRDGRPQCDALARYLRVARESGSAEVEASFIAVLTDFVGSAFEGAPDPAEHEDL